MRRALARARDGKPLDPAEATVLLHARGGDLQTLLGYASRTRDAGLEAAKRPGIITYSRKVFIPLTRLCRDRCGYCTFATVPHRLDGLYLEPDQVLAIARQGAALGCKEALFTLGDKPEDRWSQARDWLDAHGYDDTLSYVRAMAIRVLEETGLLPHLNPGVLSWPDFQRLKPVAPSMGMMLETTATRLFTEKGAPHFGSPDKDPATRLRVLEDAGRSNVPFTTGILIGIGETRQERAESIFAIRKVAREYRGIQEVIVQNFRAKPDTKMRDAPDAELDDLAATIAVTRLVLGSKARVQAPPNLVGAQYDLILRLALTTGAASPRSPRTTSTPSARGRTSTTWPRTPPPRASRCASGSPSTRPTCASRGWTRGWPGTWPRWPTRRPAWPPRRRAARPGRGRNPTAAGGSRVRAARTCTSASTLTGRTHDRREDFAEVYGDWPRSPNEAGTRPGSAPGPGGTAAPVPGHPGGGRSGCSRPGEVAAALRQAERDPAASPTTRPSPCSAADGPTSRRWPGSPTRCAARSSATTSPTS